MANWAQGSWPWAQGPGQRLMIREGLFMYPPNEAERVQWPTGPRALGPGPMAQDKGL